MPRMTYDQAAPRVIDVVRREFPTVTDDELPVLLARATAFANRPKAAQELDPEPMTPAEFRAAQRQIEASRAVVIDREVDAMVAEIEQDQALAAKPRKRTTTAKSATTVAKAPRKATKRLSAKFPELKHRVSRYRTEHPGADARDAWMAIKGDYRPGFFMTFPNFRLHYWA